MLAPAPLNKDRTPSAATIWRPASRDDLYLTAYEHTLSADGLGRLKCSTYLARCHHHTTTDGIERVRADTSTSGDSPAEQERSQEVTLEGSDEQDRLDRIVHSEVQTAVDDDTGNGRTETTVETKDTIASKSISVDIDEAVELTSTSGFGILGIVGQTSTGVVEGVDEEQRSSSGSLFELAIRHESNFKSVPYTTGGKIAHHPLGITIPVLLERKHRLVCITEGEVERLGREVTDDIGSVTTPQRGDTFVGGGTSEALSDTIVFAVQTAGLQHLILFKVTLLASFKHLPRVRSLRAAQDGVSGHLATQCSQMRGQIDGNSTGSW